MWWSEGRLREVIRSVLCSEKTEHGKVCDLKRQIEELELKKRLEQQEIEHLVKMKEEKQLIAVQKKENELVAKYQQKEMALQTEYHGKVLATIEKAHTDIKEIYTQIMARLPNVNVEMKR